MAHYELYNYNNNSRTRFIKPSIVDRTGFKRSCCEVAHNAYSEAMERGTRGAPAERARFDKRQAPKSQTQHRLGEFLPSLSRGVFEAWDCEKPVPTESALISERTAEFSP
jgi:hypothetical protein